MIGNEKDYLATRVSYKLDLRGPSLNIQTACSTSLVAVARPCQACCTASATWRWPAASRSRSRRSAATSTRRGASPRPTATAAPSTRSAAGHGLQQRRWASWCSSGSRTRSPTATPIYAVIKGAALNNDGAAKVSFTAPSVDGQAEVIAAAQALAGVDPDTIAYVEAHGTATPLGDPIEVAGADPGLPRAEPSRPGFCALGSVKTNIGHLDAAAGRGGPDQDRARAAAPRRSRRACTSRRPTRSSTSRDEPVLRRTRGCAVAGRTRPAAGRRQLASGVGGTNAHVVLEEAPAGAAPRPPPARSSSSCSRRGRGRRSTAADGATWPTHLEAHPELDLADVAFTLQAGPPRLRAPARRVVAATARRPSGALRAPAARRARSATAGSVRRAASVAFLFPGPGLAVRWRWAGASTRREPVFRAERRRCAESSAASSASTCARVLYPRPATPRPRRERSRQTALTQPALFVVEYALAQLWSAGASSRPR